MFLPKALFQLVPGTLRASPFRLVALAPSRGTPPEKKPTSEISWRPMGVDENATVTHKNSKTAEARPAASGRQRRAECVFHPFLPTSYSSAIISVRIVRMANQSSLTQLKRINTGTVLSYSWHCCIIPNSVGSTNPISFYISQTQTKWFNPHEDHDACTFLVIHPQFCWGNFKNGVNHGKPIVNHPQLGLMIGCRTNTTGIIKNPISDEREGFPESHPRRITGPIEVWFHPLSNHGFFLGVSGVKNMNGGWDSHHCWFDISHEAKNWIPNFIMVKIQHSPDLHQRRCASQSSMPWPRPITCRRQRPESLQTRVHLVCWIWGVPKIVVPLNHPFLDGIFPYKPSIWRYPNLWKAPFSETPKLLLDDSGRFESLEFWMILDHYPVFFQFPLVSFSWFWVLKKKRFVSRQQIWGSNQNHRTRGSKSLFQIGNVGRDSFWVVKCCRPDHAGGRPPVPTPASRHVAGRVQPHSWLHQNLYQTSDCQIWSQIVAIAFNSNSLAGVAAMLHGTHLEPPRGVLEPGFFKRKSYHWNVRYVFVAIQNHLIRFAKNNQETDSHFMSQCPIFVCLSHSSMDLCNSSNKDLT